VRQRLRERDLARRDGGAEPAASVGDELAAQRVAGRNAGGEEDERLDHGAGDRIGNADHARLRHGRVLEQHALDLERPDQMAGGLDDVVTAADEPEVAVRVTPHQVAAQVPAVGEAAPVALGLVQVRPEHRRPGRPERELALRSGLAQLDRAPVDEPEVSLAVALEDGGVDARQGTAHRARLDVHGGVVGDHDPAGLGLPPVVVHGQAESLLAPDDRLGVQRLADAGDETERAQISLARELDTRPDEHPDRGRGGVPDGHALLLEDAVPAAGVELALVDDERDAVRERRDDPVGGARNPAGVGRAPEDVLRMQIERHGAGRVMGHDGLVHMHGALRGSRRTAREVQQRRRLRIGRGDPPVAGLLGEQGR
jgi:hypothetical protein